MSCQTLSTTTKDTNEGTGAIHSIFLKPRNILEGFVSARLCLQVLLDTQTATLEKFQTQNWKMDPIIGKETVE